MKPHGQYKIRNRRESDRIPPGQDLEVAAASEDPADIAPGMLDELFEEIEHADSNTQRLLNSLREEILAAGGGLQLRIRQVFTKPREIFRVEIELPDHSYLRTTFLDRDALESLLEADDVRAVVETGQLGQGQDPNRCET